MFSFGARTRHEQESLMQLTEGAPKGSPPTHRPWVNATGKRFGRGLSLMGTCTFFSVGLSSFAFNPHKEL